MRRARSCGGTRPCRGCGGDSGVKTPGKRGFLGTCGAAPLPGKELGAPAAVPIPWDLPRSRWRDPGPAGHRSPGHCPEDGGLWSVYEPTLWHPRPSREHCNHDDAGGCLASPCPIPPSQPPTPGLILPRQRRRRGCPGVTQRNRSSALVPGGLFSPWMREKLGVQPSPGGTMLPAAMGGRQEGASPALASGAGPAGR